MFRINLIPLLSLPPSRRRLFLIVFDSFLLLLSVWLGFWLRLAHPYHPAFVESGSWILFAVLPIGLPLFLLTGQYKGLTRYVGSSSLYRLSVRNGLLVILLACFGVMFGLQCPPQ